MSELELSYSQYLELEKLALGAFAPLSGFMNEDDFFSVVRHMRLTDGSVFPLPVLLDVSLENANRLRGCPTIGLFYKNTEVGSLSLESIFTCDKQSVSQEVYGTRSIEHPGVRFFEAGGDWFLGGAVKLKQRVRSKLSPDELMPNQTKQIIADQGWNTVVGFQTRNVPHRAHEYLQRVALEQVDGLFLQPLVGRKKRGDYTPEAVIQGYRALIKYFYPKDRVMFGILMTSMRYAGPREAIFHAIIRRNYGCTHFIVGRDHAGVGNYYGLYEAHALAERFAGELGIHILQLHGPYYCSICETIATEKTCPHESSQPDSVHHISGTDMRAILSGGQEPQPHLMRPEIVKALEGISLFIEEEEF
jgi:sulfate adenylyltransferase